MLEQSAPIRRELTAGLDRVAETVAVGHGYAEAHLGISSSTGAFARGELGYRFRENLSGFGFLEGNRAGVVGGAGLRLTF